jgi:hypothetical protein
MTRREYFETASSPDEYSDLFRHTFGPMVAIRAGLDEPGRAGLDVAFLKFIERWNRGTPGQTVKIPYEYLLAIARTAAA